MIYLAQVLALLQNIKCSTPTYLVGGIVDRGFSENDVDLVRSKYAFPGENHRLLSDIPTPHHIPPEDLARPLASPLLPIGAPSLWDYADKKSYPQDEFLAHSSFYWLTQLAPLLKDKSVLDVGCGQGETLASLLHFLDAHPTGISTSEEDIRICHLNNLEAYLMDQNLLEFDDNSFDIVWSHHTLEHSVAPILVVREAARVLKPEGILALTVGTGKAPGHYYRFDPETLRNMLSDSGFTIAHSRESHFGFSSEIYIQARKDSHAPE